MNITVNAKHITLTDAIRDYSEKKIQRIAKYFDDKMDIHVNLNVEKNMHIAEIFVNVKGMFLKGIEKSEDMYASIDMVEEIIERQLRKYKNKLVDQKQSSGSFTKAFAEEEAAEDEEIKVVRTKRFAVKPMDVEEACIQMELLGHNFFVFRNAETDEVNVVYKRKGNTYGLIEPEY